MRTERASAQMPVPKAWNDEAIDSLEVPSPARDSTPTHVRSEYYYRIPVRPMHHSDRGHSVRLTRLQRPAERPRYPDQHESERKSIRQCLRFILHLLRTSESILRESPTFGEFDALCLSRWVGSWILVQPVASIVHQIAAKQATIPPGDHALGADVHSRRHFFERQQALFA